MVFVLTFKNALEFLKVSAEGAKNVSQLNPFDHRVVREGWWFEHFVS